VTRGAWLPLSGLLQQLSSSFWVLCCDCIWLPNCRESYVHYKCLVHLVNVLLTMHHNISYSWSKKMHYMFSVYCELTASTCFEHYLFIIRRHCIYNNWYIACVLCWLAASRVAASWHNTHKIYQLLYMQCLLMMSKWCTKHVEVANS
jgi:hypothetical protein